MFLQGLAPELVMIDNPEKAGLFEKVRKYTRLFTKVDP